MSKLNKYISFKAYLSQNTNLYEKQKSLGFQIVKSIIKDDIDILTKEDKELILNKPLAFYTVEEDSEHIFSDLLRSLRAISNEPYYTECDLYNFLSLIELFHADNISEAVAVLNGYFKYFYEEIESDKNES